MVPHAAGLIEMNGGNDKVTVNADYGINYDSNLFARAGGAGDTNEALTAGANYTRSGGMIGFSSTASVTNSRFRKFSNENFTDPSLALEFTKNGGRLTGSLSVNGGRESRSDDAANLFTNSWNYGIALGLRYPVNDRYYLTSSTAANVRDYTQETVLFNLSSISEGVDLYYVYPSKLDILGGYRIRFGEAQGGTGTRDIAYTVGATGAILPKLSGTLRAGYQTRDESGNSGGHYNDLTAEFSLAWPLNKRTTFNFQASEDFMTTATDTSVDATAFDLSGTIKPNLKLKVAFTGEAGYTISRYLGVRGGGREDRTLSFTGHLTVPIKAHFAASLTCGYYTNHSSYAFSKFARRTASFDVSVHY